MKNAYVTNLYLKPSPGTTDQRLTVSSSAVQFSAFATQTDAVMLQVQDADVFCTIDGSTPTNTNGFYLAQNTSYNWSKSMAGAAKFIRGDATDAKIHAQECAV